MRGFTNIRKMLSDASNVALDAVQEGRQAVDGLSRLVASALVVGGGTLALVISQNVVEPILCYIAEDLLELELNMIVPGPSHVPSDRDQNIASCEDLTPIKVLGVAVVVGAAAYGYSKFSKRNAAPENTSTESSSLDDVRKNNGPASR